nr:prepilin-type N-terminal cleavage/methylation domain-containing protein [Blastochloris sulfoviridis]
MSRRRRTRCARGDAGFTLIEMVCVIAMVALLAAILVPRVPRGTSQPRLEAYALEAAALLKADRTAAIRHRRHVAAQVDATGRTVISGSSGRILRLPEDVAFEALLPQTCEGRPALSTISFFSSGMSCGGVIRLMRFGNGFDVRVNWLTGGIDIVARGGR